MINHHFYAVIVALKASKAQSSQRKGSSASVLRREVRAVRAEAASESSDLAPRPDNTMGLWRKNESRGITGHMMDINQIHGLHGYHITTIDIFVS